MAYFAPYIDKTGLHMPTYIDVRDRLVEDARLIFGQDIYLGEDSQDYQWIATVSEKIYDAFQISQSVYNNRAPNTAIGTGLDSIVKINGIKRKAKDYSKCPVIISGVKNTTIKNGIVTDKGNIKWNLPYTVTIPESGQIEVMAVCQIPGPIVANPGDITEIYNPTFGWNGVYNEVNAELGAYVEEDPKLRKRQSQSTAQASLTMLEGTSGAVAQVKKVKRSRVYENDTNQIDELGLPPHSITVVAEGGEDKEIAEAIRIHKGIGCYTNGDVSIKIKGIEGPPIRFFRPTYIDIEVTINIKPLSGYTTETTESIKKNLQTYLNSMEIGSNLSLSSLWGAALQAMPNLMDPMFSITGITAARVGEEQKPDDIELKFNEVCRGNINYITANII
ncbi:baseplate J/gp47 family protein [Clostridium botulinum]|uniref:baseplate J/gp47 family protein n=1 Tax=Clostridium botulinum TaxID=1491 RepID=UPI00059E7B92|nr:baseplate J/gp47 family protein [Clostridium botulinum]KIN80932.1 phage Mu protein gp47-like protein [Clostridium botulinum]MCC5425811.1 baseplate J/gp47 family protein [Clostridium botulinum]MCC5437660.1 baseplate J/gp47 family protein [Clostridium botulinum]